MKGAEAGARCLVIGGGILGLCCALELRRAGLAVTVIDRGDPGREASGAAGGILCPLYPWRIRPELDALTREGRRLYPTLARMLRRRSAIDPVMQTTGMLVLEDRESAWARAWARARGERVETLSAAAAARRQPGITPRPALWLPRVACIDNRRLLRALTRALPGAGVTVRPRVAARGFALRGDRLRAVHTDYGPFPCETAVVAAGAWSGALLQELGLPACVYPVRGQMIALRPAAPNPLRCVLLQDGRYLVPRGGLVLAGSTLEAAGFDKRPTAEAAQRLRHAATAMLPGLAPCPVRARWTGLRPATADGLPLIGSVPGAGGVYLATGHYRNGVLAAPATARLVAALATRGAAPPAAFDPARPLPAVAEGALPGVLRGAPGPGSPGARRQGSARHRLREAAQRRTMSTPEHLVSPQAAGDCKTERNEHAALRDRAPGTPGAE